MVVHHFTFPGEALKIFIFTGANTSRRVFAVLLGVGQLCAAACQNPPRATGVSCPPEEVEIRNFSPIGRFMMCTDGAGKVMHEGLVKSYALDRRGRSLRFVFHTNPESPCWAASNDEHCYSSRFEGNWFCEFRNDSLPEKKP